jgi:hypothetical protein
LWQEDKEGRPIWPCGELAIVNVQPLKNLDEILKGIFGFIKYWEKLSNEDSTRKYRRHYKQLHYYWRIRKDALVLLVEPLASLQDGFWPTTQFALGLED